MATLKILWTRPISYDIYIHVLASLSLTQTLHERSLVGSIGIHLKPLDFSRYMPKTTHLRLRFDYSSDMAMYPVLEVGLPTTSALAAWSNPYGILCASPLRRSDTSGQHGAPTCSMVWTTPMRNPSALTFV